VVNRYATALYIEDDRSSGERYEECATLGIAARFKAVTLLFPNHCWHRCSSYAAVPSQRNYFKKQRMVNKRRPEAR
jgi:hypothetical protein